MVEKVICIVDVLSSIKNKPFCKEGKVYNHTKLDSLFCPYAVWDIDSDGQDKHYLTLDTFNYHFREYDRWEIEDQEILI